MKLIDTRRPDDAATAYANILRWPLSVGYRHRPRQGCTCEAADCTVPGAHPRSDSPVFFTPKLVVEELEESPGAGLIAWTTGFDALVFPRTAGMAAMVALDKVAQVPCIVTDESVILLVLPATGRHVTAYRADVGLRSGSGDWIAVPPSHGTRWDTPPWVPRANTPIPLLHGTEVGHCLSQGASDAPGEVAR
ncbi:hypothetical protein ACFQ6N_01320 [Kitasatospora sp. NPDC056446]|uniref:hypothetical protein n=1 Tax=Kitasatospora sp. NPDC056446 TaxID=3345819 RepID=UPI0036A18A28